LSTIRQLKLPGFGARGYRGNNVRIGMPTVGDKLLGAVDDEVFAIGVQAGFRQVEMRAGAVLG
jgi:hypothetical protein